MKVLTIRQPWVWAILEAGKRIENRPRFTHYRGPIYIHAGRAVPNWQPLADAESRCGRYPDPDDMQVMEYGHIVAKAELVACVWSDVIAPPWGEPGCYHWHLDNVRRLRTPLAARGQLGLWNYP